MDLTFYVDCLGPREEPSNTSRTMADKDLTKERLCRITADGLVHSIRIDSTIAIGQFKPLAECRRQKFL